MRPPRRKKGYLLPLGSMELVEETVARSEWIDDMIEWDEIMELTPRTREQLALMWDEMSRPDREAACVSIKTNLEIARVANMVV